MSAHDPAVADVFDEDEVPAEEVDMPSIFMPESTEFNAMLADYKPQTGAYLTHANKKIPDVVAQFLTHFQTHLADKNTWELHAFYENSFNKLTEKFYQKSPWPQAESISHLVGDDPAFLILYKELYYRHLYSKLQPSVEDRIGSYMNYCELFEFILSKTLLVVELVFHIPLAYSTCNSRRCGFLVMKDDSCDLDLPSQWLWDIIDEFIYQFQAFSQFRVRTKSKNDADLELLKGRSDVWNVDGVLGYLHALVQKSQINEQLIALRNGEDMNAAAGEFGIKQLYRMLGYFSLVGLLRVHCLLADYSQALSTLENVEPGQRGLFSRITACHVTTYYYIGFAYMMMGRYYDAVKMFANVLNFVSRTKQYHTRSHQNEMILRRSDQMYALLAMCLVLSPQKIDENINNTLKEKNGEHLLKMHKGEEGLSSFEELFLFSCPKFICVVSGDQDLSGIAPHDPVKHQCRIFLRQAKSCIAVPTLRSYLKLYSNLPVSKLAGFLEVSEDEVRTQLLTFKHKSRQTVWTSGPISSGTLSPTSDIQLYLKQDQIYIAENKVGRRVADWFIRNMN
eukprot:jgi/Hompol1/1388/HPOL_000059-RA